MPSIAATSSELATGGPLLDDLGRDYDRPLTLAILRRMVRNGVSKFSPDPLGECAVAERCSSMHEHEVIEWLR